MKELTDHKLTHRLISKLGPAFFCRETKRVCLITSRLTNYQNVEIEVRGGGYEEYPNDNDSTLPQFFVDGSKKHVRVVTPKSDRVYEPLIGIHDLKGKKLLFEPNVFLCDYQGKLYNIELEDNDMVLYDETGKRELFRIDQGEYGRARVPLKMGPISMLYPYAFADKKLRI